MEFHTLSKKKLEDKVVKLRTEASDLLFDIRSGDTGQLNDYREAKRDLARALTILKEKELGIKRKVVEKKPVEKKTATKKVAKKTIKKIKTNGKEKSSK